MTPEKTKVYELDFGDTNLLSLNTGDITRWIASDMEDMKEGETLEYSITIKMMTQKEIDTMPEWA